MNLVERGTASRRPRVVNRACPAPGLLPEPWPTSRAGRVTTPALAVGLALLLGAGTGAAQGTTPPTVQRAAVNGKTLSLTFTEPLAPKDTAPAIPLEWAFSVPCDNANAHPDGVSVVGSIVTLTLPHAVVAGKRVELSYRPEWTSDPLRAADDGAEAQSTDNRAKAQSATGAARLVEQFLDLRVTNETRGATSALKSAGGQASSCPFKATKNTPATGAPAIGGVARVGETLTASTADIADADGLSGATFAYQWLSNGGDGDSEIAGATGASYTLADAQMGTTVKVLASFADDSGHEETLTSAATEAVAPRALPPLANRAPMADAGENGEADPGTTVALDGSGSTDPDGDALTFAWSQTSGEAVTLEGANTATPSFEAPAAPGVLTFRLMVRDSHDLTASDTVMVTVRARTAHIALFESAANPVRDSFVRVINHSGEGGEVRIVAIDDAGVEYGPLTLRIGANAAVHITSADLEAGNAERGLSGGVGEGEGDWRLELTTELDLEVLSYVRTPDGGALASMHDVVPEDEAGHRVVFFNPASNRGRVSWLRLINPGDEAAAVRIEGVDDAGEAGESAVELTLAAGASRALSAQALESGEGEGLAGALGDGAGKWRLRVTADRPIRVMSLLRSVDGSLTNVSTAPGRP